MWLAKPTRLQVCHKGSDELATITWIHLRIKIAVEGVNENALRPFVFLPISQSPPNPPMRRSIQLVNQSMRKWVPGYCSARTTPSGGAPI
jgi:hypothetical protein